MPNLNTMPDQHAEVVAPNDGTDLPKGKTKALYVGGAGNLSVDMVSGATVLISGVPAGTRLPFSVKRVRAASTTATLILAIY